MSIPIFRPGENERDITLEAPGLFVLEFGEFSTAGYEWDVLSVEPEAMLRVESSKLLVAPSSKGGNTGGETAPQSGGANIRRFQIRAMQPGNALLRMRLKRSWEADPAQIMEFKVLCRPVR